MKAGRLRHSMSLYAVTYGSDAYGGHNETPGSPVTVYAEIEPLQGEELVAAQQLAPHSTHRIRTRYYSGLTTKHYLTFGSRKFNIVNIVDMFERNREHVLLCKEVA